jgi:adenylate kinase
MSYPSPQRPNILITGTPGTGKTSLTELLVELSEGQLTSINIGAIVKDKELHSGRDEKFDAFLIDEDAVVDAMEEKMVAGGVIVDHHGCDFFPERWFHVVVVLQTGTEALFDRLSARGYSKEKVEENMEAEIMRVVENEAKESYKEGMVAVLESNNTQDLQNNAELILTQYEKLLSGQ